MPVFSDPIYSVSSDESLVIQTSIISWYALFLFVLCFFLQKLLAVWLDSCGSMWASPSCANLVGPWCFKTGYYSFFLFPLIWWSSASKESDTFTVRHIISVFSYYQTIFLLLKDFWASSSFAQWKLECISGRLVLPPRSLRKQEAAPTRWRLSARWHVSSVGSGQRLWANPRTRREVTSESLCRGKLWNLEMHD